MLATASAQVTSISGKIGGAVYRTVGGTINISSRVTSAQSSGGITSSGGTRLTTARKGWNKLTTAQQNSWAILGDKSNMSGWQAYLRYYDWTQESKSLTTWPSETSGIPTAQWVGIFRYEWLNLFVALSIDSPGLIYTSADSYNWTACTNPTTTQWYAGCQSTDTNMAVIVGGPSGTCAAYSTDGVTWQNGSTAPAGTWVSVCYSPTQHIFVAVNSTSGTRVMTSTDGITWTGRTGPSGSTWSSVCWSTLLNKFIAVGNSGTYHCMTSPDGVTWTGQSTPTGFGSLCVCDAPGLGYVIAGGVSAGKYAWKTTDGINWTVISTGLQTYAKSISYSASGIMLMQNTGSATNCIAFSTDATSWAIYGTTGSVLLQQSCWDPWNAIFVSVSYSTAICIVRSPITIKPLGSDNMPLFLGWQDNINYPACTIESLLMPLPSSKGWSWTYSKVGSTSYITGAALADFDSTQGQNYLEISAGTSVGSLTASYRKKYYKLGTVEIWNPSQTLPALALPSNITASHGTILPLKLRYISRGGRRSNPTDFKYALL